MADFAPHHAIVTASDSGIGRASAIALADAGLDVGITWHSDRDGAEGTAEAVRARGVRAVVTRLDVADAPACGDVIDGLIDELGGVDVFVNNAGTGGGTPFFDLTWDEWRTTIATDLDGAFVVLQRAARRMVDAGNGGRLIAITSVHEHQPRVGSAAYDAAKHGLGGLMKTLALELGREDHRERGRPRRDRHRDEPVRRAGSVPHRTPRRAARATGARRRDRGRRRLPRLAGGVVRDRGILGGRRRDAADGPAGRLAPHRARLARALIIG
ncbi:hypothetical protein GCM10025881_13360 [Pseudolysinimonas kribbensis]|uniref:SDR family oxidoreductase n=1 Tax=Pseudolysinimonas kribbensis TaxID=433641 RepID=A0ABQ6K1N7_9MICO|nr:hypothetical protein GCM10025881_13360 [Pseudolysinimonas kribbensis]